MSTEQIEPYAAAIRKLLNGVVYHDDPVWSQVRDYELPIREYLAKIGISVHLDEIGNFAFLHDESRDEDGQTVLPPLTTRRSLSFTDTLLLVLLRERLDEHELRDLDGGPLILGEEEIAEMVSLFMADAPNTQTIEKGIATSINRLKSYGFLTQLRSGGYIVRPLLRAKLTADNLVEVKERLTRYVHQDDASGDNENGYAGDAEDDESV